MIEYSKNPIAHLKAAIAIMFVLTGMLAPMGHAQSGGNTVQIANSTRYSIQEVYLSATGDPDWHQDRLGAGTLDPGHIFTTHLYNGLYDLKLVDEDGDVCEVHRVQVNGPTYWRINSSWLLNCEFHR
jgi:hypothetical protein